MKTLHWHDVCGLACKAAGKWGVYVSNGIDDTKECDNEIHEFVMEYIDKHWPKYVDGKHNQENHEAWFAFVFSNLIMFDTEEEMDKYYWIFEQPLTDSSVVYACTFDPNGHGITENT